MKAGTESLAKFKKLQRRLGLRVWQAVGLLESIWRVTAANAPRGDIGRLSNEDIASLIEWDGDENAMIAALVDYRWLDKCDVNRLVVHDWEDHCPLYVKANIHKHGKDFARANSPKEPPREPPRDAPREPPKEPPRDTPTKSSQVKSSQDRLIDRSDEEKIFIEKEQLEAVRAEANRIAEIAPLGNNGKRLTDRIFTLKLAVLSVTNTIPQIVLADAYQAVKERQPATPSRYLKTCVENNGLAAGYNVPHLLAQVELGEWAEEILTGEKPKRSGKLNGKN